MSEPTPIGEAEAQSGIAATANHVSNVRRHLLDQMAALRAAGNPDAVRTEIERSKGLAELAQAVVNTAKVEVDYLKLTDQQSTPFLEPPRYVRVASNGDGAPASDTGIVSITRHVLGR